MQVGGGLGARLDAALFGESGHRAIVTTSLESAASLRALAAAHHVPHTELGRVGGDQIAISDAIAIAVSAAASVWESALPRLLDI